MAKQFLSLLAFVAFLILAVGFNSTSQPNKLRTATGHLTEPAFRLLQQLLQPFATAKLNDTLILKYDFNKDDCWNITDQRKDEDIQPLVLSSKQRIQTAALTRPNVSIFRFREPGNNLNKLIKWDESIFIDSTRQLYQLLFKKRTECGSSMIIFPDKRFILLYSDSHFEALDLSKKQMEELINKK